MVLTAWKKVVKEKGEEIAGGALLNRCATNYTMVAFAASRTRTCAPCGYEVTASLTAPR